MIVPDSRWEIPALLTPGQKPVGNVIIDWSNPLTQKLSEYFLFDGTIKNLVNGRIYTRPQNWVYEVNQRGQRVNNPTENLSYLVTNDTLTGYDFGTYPDGRTVYFQGAPGTITAGPQGLFAEGGLGDGYCVIYRTTPDTLNYYYASASGADVTNQASGTTFAPGELIKLFFTYSAKNNNIQAMIDGVVDYTSGTVGAMGAHLATPCVGYANSFNNGRWYGYFELFAKWDRELSDAEKVSFNANPYQFLIPA